MNGNDKIPQITQMTDNLSGKAFRERLEGYGSPDWLWEVGHGPVATVFPLGDQQKQFRKLQRDLQLCF